MPIAAKRLIRTGTAFKLNYTVMREWKETTSRILAGTTSTDKVTVRGAVLSNTAVTFGRHPRSVAVTGVNN
jgi:hypothetical protein